MRKAAALSIALLFGIAITVFWFSDLTIPKNSNELSRLKAQVYHRLGGDLRDIDPTMNAPIDFFGKVVDENGQPVADADVKIIWLGWSTEEKPPLMLKSDVQGLFSVTNKRGQGVLVSVSKHGYYTPKRESSSFKYGDVREKNFHRANAANPVVFQLKRKGQAEPLFVTDKSFRIAKDGTPVEIDLTSGKAVPLGHGQFRVECWTNDKEKVGKRYNWKCRVSVPGGGLLEYSDELEFQAPSEGYQGFDEIEMPASLGQDWKRDAKRRYFLKLANGNYARISFQIIPGGDHFFMITSFLNPSGSPNLEYDEAVQPKQKIFE